MGLFWSGKDEDRNGMRDDHFGSRERKALADENNRTIQESKRNIARRAEEAETRGMDRKWFGNK